MKEPNGKDLLATLIKLYAEQEGVKITYEIEETEGEKNGNTYKLCNNLCQHYSCSCGRVSMKRNSLPLKTEL